MTQSWSRIILIITQLLMPVTILADNGDLHAIKQNTEFYDPSSCIGGSADSSDSTSSTPSGSGLTVDNDSATKVAKAAKANVGYAIYDQTGKSLGSYNSTFENYGASITKSLILVAYMRQLDAGKATMTAAQKAVVTAMIEQSDNASADTVYRQYLTNGASQVTTVANDAGMGSSFKLTTADPIYVLGQSQINADGFAKFFSKIQTMIPASQRDFALGLLSNITPQAGILQAGIPVTVYSKEGWKAEPDSSNPLGNEGAPYVVNQAASFTVSGTTYGLAITVGGTTNEATGEGIAKDVASALLKFGSSTSAAGTCCAGADSASTNITQGKDAIDTAMKTLTSNLSLTPAQAAGIVGNLMWESGGGVLLNPKAQQDGSKDANPKAGVGFGIAQWTPSTRQQGLVTLAKQNGVQPNTLNVQLQYLQDELQAKSPATDQSAALKAVKSTSNVVDATTKFMTIYEAPSDPQLANRIKGAQAALSAYSGGSASGAASATSSNVGSCSSGGGSASSSSISKEAMILAWPKPDCQQSFTDSGGTHETRTSCNDASGNYKNASTIAYRKAWDGASDQTDCGAFVASVMIATGADKNYPKVGTIVQESYVTSHPKLYQTIKGVSSSAQLHPGDILVAAYINGGSGHTAIYTGTAPGKSGFVAAASLGGHTPQMDGVNSAGEIVYIMHGSPTAAVRFIGGS